MANEKTMTTLQDELERHCTCMGQDLCLECRAAAQLEALTARVTELEGMHANAQGPTVQNRLRSVHALRNTWLLGLTPSLGYQCCTS
jgi:hypothetical protein